MSKKSLAGRHPERNRQRPAVCGPLLSCFWEPLASNVLMGCVCVLRVCDCTVLVQRVQQPSLSMVDRSSATYLR